MLALLLQLAVAQPQDLIRKAVTAAGGRAVLARYHALEWEAGAVVHVPGGDVAIRGTWRIQPPDSAIVTTYDTTRGPGSARSLILAGPHGWMRRDTSLAPMPPELIAEERHQYYLYSLLRLLPLEAPGVTLTPVAPDSAGHQGVSVHTPGRLAVTLYFAADGPVVRMVTAFATMGGGAGDVEEVIILPERMRAQGLRWFKSLRILRGGQPYFDLTLTRLRPLRGIEDPLLKGPRSALAP